jgi:hypothetical protein
MNYPARVARYGYTKILVTLLFEKDNSIRDVTMLPLRRKKTDTYGQDVIGRVNLDG